MHTQSEFQHEFFSWNSLNLLSQCLISFKLKGEYLKCFNLLFPRNSFAQLHQTFNGKRILILSPFNSCWEIYSQKRKGLVKFKFWLSVSFCSSASASNINKISETNVREVFFVYSKLNKINNDPENDLCNLTGWFDLPDHGANIMITNFVQFVVVKIMNILGSNSTQFIFIYVLVKQNKCIA